MGGYEILQAIQSVRTPHLDRFFGIVTDLHHENIYVLLLPLLFWLYDKRFARYMFSVFTLAFWGNEMLKGLFDTPRPDPTKVVVLKPESAWGTGFPSGHAMTPAIFWGAIALHLRRPWLWAAAGTLVFFIGFSRLYLGLHFVTDVLGGWLFAALFIALLQWSSAFWSGDRQPLALQLGLALGLPALGLGVAWLIGGGHIHKMIFVMAGTYAGLLAGSALEQALVDFNPRLGSLGIQVAKVVLGLTLMLAVKEGFKLFLPDTSLADLFRYFCTALTATLIAPYLFDRLLAKPPAATITKRG